VNDPPGEPATLVTLDWLRVKGDGSAVAPATTSPGVVHLARLLLRTEYVVQGPRRRPVAPAAAGGRVAGGRRYRG